MKAQVNTECVDGVAVLVIDNPPVNAGSLAIRSQLLEAIERCGADERLCALVLIGAGRTFIAGSDLREFGLPLEEPQLPRLIAAIEACPKPVVAALHGAALGGGFELALGCDARVATADCLIGLPEVTLGMIPGAGGTQRLPRLVGAAKAIELICSGARITGAQAQALGIVDALAEGDLQRAAIDFARQAAKRPLRGLDVPDVPAELIDEACGLALRKGRGRPAVAAAIEAVLDAVRLPLDEALSRERRAFQQLRQSHEAAALRHLFFAERAAGRLPELAGVGAQPVRQVGVIGAGTMGAGIAVAFLDAGYRLILVEQSMQALEAGRQRIGQLYERQIGSGRLTQNEASERLQRFSASCSLDTLADCQLVVEAVFEDLQVKRDLVGRLSEVLGADGVIASNTSYLDLDAIAASAVRPENVCGLHFFSPANVMRLVEVVRAGATAPQTLATALDVARRLGKVPVVARNAFGFIGNRIYAAYRRQCEFMLEEGADPYRIDAAMEAFGFAMGPFAVADLSGLDIAWRMRNANAARRDPNARYVNIPDLLCEAGRLGRKTGAGYYRYENGNRLADPWVIELIERERAGKGRTPRVFNDDDIQRRLLVGMLSEAALLLREGVARHPADVDLALVNGYGFPRWKGGVMFWAAAQERAWLEQALAELVDASGPGLAIADIETIERSSSDTFA
ncbi:3-hydroxyacyl-CoA dehydrogenase NAD-binding domain-containing protein [Pseudomonas lopnurensis]|uniref:3-hydroxyacyl-CoA dehydrogenase NAD-binding domain-containing protein n=1 Tax=Pseudomonas lopnurensis TaxID=1477517 RepID=UPI0028AEE91E|nr:3-hydroxyacyl-CoA dehydrogenase NAD-binding domain-containing protein [Pseudomonas lopnurensis]